MSQFNIGSGSAKLMTATGQITPCSGALIGFRVNSTSSGTIVLLDGGAFGSVLSGTITPAVGYHNFPATFDNGLYVGITGTISVTFFFVGNQIGGTAGGTPTPTFEARLTDAGNGAVNTTLSEGTGSATFTRATTATTVNSAGLIVSVASGVARSYYDPTTLEYRGYLAEGARTNLCLYSQDISNALGWAAYAGGTATAGFSDPAGGTNGVRIDMPSALDGWHSNDITVSNGTTYAASIWIRADSAGTIRFLDGNGSGFDATLNVTTSWKPLSTSAAKSAGTTTQFAIYRNDVGQLNRVYVYASQLEAGSFATSYIPTTTAAVTRNADVLTYPVAGNYSDTAGTAYAELSVFWSSSPNGLANKAISTSTAAQSGQLITTFTMAPTVILGSDATANVSKSSLSSMRTGARKRAVSWGGAGQIITGDGLAPGTATYDGSYGTTAIGIGCGANGNEPWDGTIRNARIWQTQFTAYQLQNITE